MVIWYMYFFVHKKTSLGLSQSGFQGVVVLEEFIGIIATYKVIVQRMVTL